MIQAPHSRYDNTYTFPGSSLRQSITTSPQAGGGSESTHICSNAHFPPDRFGDEGREYFNRVDESCHRSASMARRALLSYNIVLHLSSLSAAFGSSLGPRCLFFSDQSMTKINSPTLHTSPSTIFTLHHHHLRPSPVAYKHYSPVTQPVPLVLALSCLAFSPLSACLFLIKPLPGSVQHPYGFLYISTHCPKVG